MKYFVRDKDANVYEIDLKDYMPQMGTMITCNTIKEARRCFNKLDKAFPNGAGLIERLMEIPFED